MFECPFQQFVTDVAALMCGRHEKLREKPQVAAHPTPCEPEDLISLFRDPQPASIILQRKQLKVGWVRRGNWPKAVTLGEVVDAGHDKPITSLQTLLAGGPAQDRHWTIPRCCHMRLRPTAEYSDSCGRSFSDRTSS